MKRRLYQLLEADPAPTPLARAVRWSVLALILLNVAALMLETVEGVRAEAGGLLRIVEVVSVIVFTLEYAARLWSITEDPAYTHPVRGRLRWMMTPRAMVDLVAIVPFYLPYVTADLRILRLARIFRLARIARLAEYSRAARLIAETARESRRELIVSAGFVLVLLVFSSSLMYYAEHEAQPRAFASIPKSMWWAIVTLTTVGYGDVYPVTRMGRAIAGCTAILGVATLALPTAILTAGFMEKLQAQRKKRTCPRCGAECP